MSKLEELNAYEQTTRLKLRLGTALPDDVLDSCIQALNELEELKSWRDELNGTIQDLIRKKTLGRKTG